MIEVEGGHGDYCAACERDADELRPPAGWLGEEPYRRAMQEQHEREISPLTLQGGPLPQAGSWPLGVPRPIAEQEMAAYRAYRRQHPRRAGEAGDGHSRLAGEPQSDETAPGMVG